jgi:predicted RNA methylase
MATAKKTAAAAGAGLGILAAAAGAAAAGYYFYGSEEGKKHRKVAATWAANMKSDVIKQAKKIQNIDRKTIEGIITNAQKTYMSAKNMDAAEVSKAARELKSNWQEVVKELGHGAKSAKKTVKTAAKKSVKTVKKAAKKIAK